MAEPSVFDHAIEVTERVHARIAREADRARLAATGGIATRMLELRPNCEMCDRDRGR